MSRIIRRLCVRTPSRNQAAAVDQHLLEGAVASLEAGLVRVDAFAAREAPQDVRDRRGLGQKLIEGTSHALGLTAAHQIELGLVGPDDPALRIHPAQPDGRPLEELSEFRIALRQSQMAPAFHTLRRAARLATTVTSSDG